jgi:hypothetical protein
VAKKPLDKNIKKRLIITPRGWEDLSVTPIGFFAYFKSIVFCLNFYEQEKKSRNYAGAKVLLKKGSYLCPEMGSNWWEYYFEPLAKPEVNCRLERQPFQDMILFSCRKNFSRKQAHRIIRKYIHIKPHIQNKVDSYVQENFKNQFMIGVHYRGTDKVIETPRTPYERMYEAIREIVDQLNTQDYTIFVATDEQQFVDYMRTKFNNVICTDSVRSTNNDPIHYNKTSNEPVVPGLQSYELGEEALIDCLLLSKCNILIRTYHSHFSSTAGVFNPYMPIISLSNDHKILSDENTNYHEE